jgi:hypothetical protein
MKLIAGKIDEMMSDETISSALNAQLRAFRLWYLEPFRFSFGSSLDFNIALERAKWNFVKLNYGITIGRGVSTFLRDRTDGIKLADKQTFLHNLANAFRP